ncbi:MAG: 1-acyl-sn-glycerol-3-phosphate acyltransferase [Syntrophobacterales bacterium]|nr:1-acyl-sn-glycerol-3-phosphate acyltransferase [Syntrophobacterales bacterium]
MGVTYLKTFIFIVVLTISTIAFGIGALITLFITKNSNLGHYWARLWGWLQLKVTGTRVVIKNKELVDPRETYVYMANHQSWFDIFALLAHVPGQFRWLAKEELYRIPILGQAMKLIGYIPIDRSNRAKAFESIAKAAERVREGVSIMVFPEGTRSIDGVLQPFKKGGFILAIHSKKPILPISISGSHKVMPKRSWMVHPGTITITFHPPIPTEAYTIDDRDKLIALVEEAIRKGLTPEEGGKVELKEANSGEFHRVAS